MSVAHVSRARQNSLMSANSTLAYYSPIENPVAQNTANYIHLAHLINTRRPLNPHDGKTSARPPHYTLKSTREDAGICRGGVKGQ